MILADSICFESIWIFDKFEKAGKLIFPVTFFNTGILTPHGRLDGLDREIAGEIGAGGELINPASNVVEGVRGFDVGVHRVRVGSEEARTSG